MKIDNLTKQIPVQCGTCKTEESLMRYLRLEGWIEGTYKCPKCGFKRPIMVAPQLLKKHGRVIRIEQSMCQKCDHDFITFKAKI